MSKVFLYRKRSCKYESPSYAIKTLKDLENVNDEFASFVLNKIGIDYRCSNVLKPNNIPFDEQKSRLNNPLESFDLETMMKLHKKITKHGDDPSPKCLLKVYNLVYESLRNIKLDIQSIYSNEIYKLILQVDDGVIFELKGVEYKGWFFEVPIANELYLVSIYSQDYGCGCFSNSYPLAIFSNENDAKNLEKKCNNVYQAELLKSKIEDEKINEKIVSITRFDLT